MVTRVLIVDDTVTYRKILAEALSETGVAEATATAPNGNVALRKLGADPFELVLMDIDLQGMSGLQTLRSIRSAHPEVDVIVTCDVSRGSSGATMDALELGALDFIAKPTDLPHAAAVQRLRQELKPIIRAAETKRLAGAGRPVPAGARAPAARSTPARAAPKARPKGGGPLIGVGTFSIVAIGVSTGGPNALAEVIPKIPGNFPLPIVIVQHMPPTFTGALAQSLNGSSPLEVIEARNGDPVVPGRILIAPGGRHLEVRRRPAGVVAKLTDGPPENSCRPAVDVLFRSVAEGYAGKGVLAVIMTGMGNDGMKGVQILKRNQCYCLSQSEATCVVYGMPQAVDQAGLTDESVDLGRLAGRIDELVLDVRRMGKR